METHGMELFLPADGNSAKSSKGLYANRTAGGHCDRRHFGGDFVSCVQPSAGKSTPDFVLEQLAPTGHGAGYVCERLGSLPHVFVRSLRP